MSKSLGNFFLVKDILAHYPPEVLRFFILSTHYRSPLDFSDERLAEAGRSLERLRTAVHNIRQLEKLPGGAGGEQADTVRRAAAQAKAEFYAAMDDDFNTALAISVMFSLAKEINIYYSQVVAGKAVLDAQALAEMRDAYFMMADILGILVKERAGLLEGDCELVAGLMDIIIAVRQEARQRKDWATADGIRSRLAELGIILEDSPQGVRWKRR